MKKGFTLIELLAVIVILAIIIAIAVPTVLNIVDKSKSKSNEVSKELYLRAVEQAIATKNVKEEFNPTLCEVNEDGKLMCTEGLEQEELLVEVSGTRPCKGSITIKNKEVASETLDFCDGGSITDPNDKEQEDEPPKVFYVYDVEDISLLLGGHLPSYVQSPPPEYIADGPAYNNFYLKLESKDEETIAAAYACFNLYEKEYCIRGADSTAYETNAKMLKETFVEGLFPDVTPDLSATIECVEDEESISCNTGDATRPSQGIALSSGRDGYVFLSDELGGGSGRLISIERIPSTDIGDGGYSCSEFGEAEGCENTLCGDDGSCWMIVGSLSRVY